MTKQTALALVKFDQARRELDDAIIKLQEELDQVKEVLIEASREGTRK